MSSTYIFSRRWASCGMNRCMYSCAFWNAALVVDQHFADIVREVVAHGAGDSVALAEDQKRGRAVVGGGFDLFPLRLQVIEVPLQLLGGAARRRRSG